MAVTPSKSGADHRGKMGSPDDAVVDFGNAGLFAGAEAESRTEADATAIRNIWQQ
jgi:hypothetical protein